MAADTLMLAKLHLRRGTIMKKIIALILSVATCVSMTACSGGNKKPFEASKAAYENIDVAYEITEQFASDLYEAWRLGIYDDDEILDDGVDYLAKELSLSKDELTDGVGYAIAEITGENWNEMSDEDKAKLTRDTNYYFKIMEDSLFSFCVTIVSSAYIANGKAEEAQTALDAAKTQMKELSEKYSDYEHYPNLKGY